MSGVAAAVDTLLALSPALRVLATSREPLDVEGEHLWRLGSLQIPAAERRFGGDPPQRSVVLFEGRARLVQPGFTVNDSNAAAVADICSQLEGLPLAIELAAAQAGSLSPTAISTRLDREPASDRRRGPAIVETPHPRCHRRLELPAAR